MYFTFNDHLNHNEHRDKIYSSLWLKYIHLAARYLNLLFRLFVLFFYLNNNSAHKANQEIKQLKNHFVRGGWKNLEIKCIN